MQLPSGLGSRLVCFSASVLKSSAWVQSLFLLLCSSALLQDQVGSSCISGRARWSMEGGSLCSSAGLNLPIQQHRVLCCTRGPDTLKSMFSSVSEGVVLICQVLSLERCQKQKRRGKKKATCASNHLQKKKSFRRNLLKRMTNVSKKWIFFNSSWENAIKFIFLFSLFFHSDLFLLQKRSTDII